MDKFNEVVSNLEKAFSHFEKLADVYISNLERRRKATQAQASEKARKKAFIDNLAVKVEMLHRIITKKYRGDLH